jgi:anaerobic selenocysteine-containing dehydrogenase
MEYNLKNLAKLIALNRRNFIKLIVGGAVGINLTPLPWKFTDDIAIWTQNWPWVPVPPVGEFSHINSVCTMCPGGCGIRVRKVDNRAVKIEGRTDYPVNPGGLCPLGEGGLQLLYNENIRVTGPMKRVGPRGSGKYMPISWEEALKELGGRIGDLRKKKSPEALAAIDGHPARSSMSLLVRRLLQAVGSPNYFRIPSVEDTYSMLNRLMQGTDGPMAYDLENSDFVLSFGCGLIEGWGAPGRMINAWRLWRSGPVKERPTIVQIEARASNTASKADQWLAPRPGTEAALAMGLAHVIVRENLYDKDFVEHQAFGFRDGDTPDGKKQLGFKSLVLEKYSPGIVASITGLSSTSIVSLAKSFARAKAPIALCGKGKGDLNGSLFEFMAVQSLNALVGNINQPGGVLLHEPLPLSPWPEVIMDDVASDGLKKPRLDHASGKKYPFSRSLINNLPEAIMDRGESPVDTLLIFSANPAHTLSDAGSFRNALRKIPYLVSFSPYKDETSLMADLILPNHTHLERADDIVWPTGLQYPLYGLSQPVIEPLYDTRHSGDVIIQLARMRETGVASSFPWEDFEASLKERVKGLYESGRGLTSYDESSPVWKRLSGRSLAAQEYESFDELWEKLQTGGLWYLPTHNFGNRENFFKTPTGKFEFFSTKINRVVEEVSERGLGIGVLGDEAVMPHYEVPASKTDKQKYPLLMVPYELINLSSGWLPNPPYLNKTLFDDQLRKEASFAEINPETAKSYRLKQGDRVTIQSPKGELEVRVNLFEGAMPGVVFLPLGFGHTAYDAFQKNKGVNPFEIIEGGKDPLSGQQVWWNNWVQLKKA